MSGRHTATQPANHRSRCNVYGRTYRFPADLTCFQTPRVTPRHKRKPSTAFIHPLEPRAGRGEGRGHNKTRYTSKSTQRRATSRRAPCGLLVRRHLGEQTAGSSLSYTRLVFSSCAELTMKKDFRIYPTSTKGLGTPKPSPLRLHVIARIPRLPPLTLRESQPMLSSALPPNHERLLRTTAHTNKKPRSGCRCERFLA